MVTEELAHIGGALPAIDKESEKEKLRNRIREENRIKEENRLKEEAAKKEIRELKESKEIKEEEGSDKEGKEKKRSLANGTSNSESGNDKDKAGPPKKKSKSGNMVFKFKYNMPAQTAPLPAIPAVPPVGANVYCQYRHAPGWVEASILALKGNDADVKAKLLVKGLPHYRAFWATPAQIKYSLDIPFPPFLSLFFLSLSLPLF